MLAISKIGNDNLVFGALTDGSQWIFYVLEKSIQYFVSSILTDVGLIQAVLSEFIQGRMPPGAELLEDSFKGEEEPPSPSK